MQGHLLNDYFGGPGRAYNMKPITRTANKKHLDKVETTVWVLIEYENKVVRYRVDVVYGIHPKRSLKNLNEKKRKMMEYEEKSLATGFKIRWRELEYNNKTKKWEDDKKKKEHTPPEIENDLPEGDFDIK